MQLRKACNHPFLFETSLNEHLPATEIFQQSGKVKMLDQLLTALFQRGHRVLVFSQMTRILDILERWVEEEKGWKYFRIDGTTKQADRLT